MSEVILFNNEEEFVFVDNEPGLGEVQSHDIKRSRSAFIKSNEGATISFMIRPLKVGNITIKVIAESMLAGDGIERQLKVEPEGVPQFLNEAIFLDLRTSNDFSKTLELDIPGNAVPDSTHIEVSAIGDILGPSIDNLDSLM
jgi:CD109 antigen